LVLDAQDPVKHVEVFPCISRKSEKFTLDDLATISEVGKLYNVIFNVSCAHIVVSKREASLSLTLVHNDVFA